MTRLLLLLVLLIGCYDPPATTRCDEELPEPDPEWSCDDARDSLSSLMDELDTCEVDADCGIVVRGTSCGCTRSPVLPTAAAEHICEYEEALEQSVASCGAASTSCDCAEVLGIGCVLGECTWIR